MLSEADEIWEELKYEKMIVSDFAECGYIGKNHNRIYFSKQKTLDFKLCQDLTMQELEAINLKCRELGWIGGEDE